MSDIYASRRDHTPAAGALVTDAHSAAAGKKRSKPKPMSLAELHQSVKLTQQQKSNITQEHEKEMAATKKNAMVRANSNTVASSTAANTLNNSSNHRTLLLSETSISLILHFLPLSSRLSVGLTCKSWYTASCSRLAWSGSVARVYVTGSREERRRKSGGGGSEEGEEMSASKNFNPNSISSTAAKSSIISAASSSSSSTTSVPSTTSLLTSHPLNHISSFLPLFHNMRFLIYTFASPSIRTQIACPYSNDIFVTDVIESECPFEKLEKGALTFLTALSLRNMIVCTRESLSASFARIGVQTHAYLRALEIQPAAVLSPHEQGRMCNDILKEVGARLTNLEVLVLSQRNLHSSIRLEPLLSLSNLHTLVFHASFAKTTERLLSVRKLSLHNSLRTLVWPGWNHAQLKLMFGGVARPKEEEEEEEEKIKQEQKDSELKEESAEAAETENAAAAATEPQLEEQPIIGLDDEETALAADTQNSSSESRPSFQFTSWTFDHDITPLDLQQYFTCVPSLFPHLTTLSIMQPMKFALLVDKLPQVLATLPSLTALRIHVSHYSLGGDFWHALCVTPLPKLRKLRLDQLNLVHQQSSSSSFLPSSSSIASVLPPPPHFLRSFPNLTDLSFVNQVLPNLRGMHKDVPHLHALRLEGVEMARVDGSSDGTSLKELMDELAKCASLQTLYLLHNDDLIDIESLHPLAAASNLMSLQVCMLPASTVHRTPHTNVKCDHEWIDVSTRIFDDDEEDQEERTSKKSSSSGTSSSSSSSSSSASTSYQLSREYQSFLRLHQLIQENRRKQKRSTSKSKSNVQSSEQTTVSSIITYCTGMRITYWDTSQLTRRVIEAKRI